MKIWYDTEFIEDGETIRLISIGLVAEDGRELYRIVEDEDIIDRAADHDWLRDNVLPHLPVKLDTKGPYSWDWDPSHPDWSEVWLRDEIADHVREFIQATPDAELWAWYGAFDHVALAWLYGPMSQLPAGIPMWTNDLRQEYARYGLDEALPAQPDGEHNALADARHNRTRATFLAEHSGEDPRHLIEIRETGWTIKHPLTCRPTLFECPVNRAAEQLFGPPASPGRYPCEVDQNGHLVVDATARL